MSYLLFKKRLQQLSDFHQEDPPDAYADSFKEGAEWARKYILKHEIKDFEAKYKQQSEALASVNRKLEIAQKRLKQISEYNWTSSGPSGCDNHCIPHPCGRCFTDLHNEKAVAKKALKEIDK